MPPIHLATFGSLRRRFGGELVESTARADEAARLTEYLRDLGFVLVTASDLLSAIEATASEEELAAYSCIEGVAVTHASDGWWLLFPNGALDSAMCDPTDQTSLAFGDRPC